MGSKRDGQPREAAGAIPDCAASWEAGRGRSLGLEETDFSCGRGSVLAPWPQGLSQVPCSHLLGAALWLGAGTPGGTPAALPARLQLWL